MPFYQNVYFYRIGGYKTGECDQPASVGLALRCLVVPGPVVFTLIALMILWRYPIDEKRRKEIKEELERLKYGFSPDIVVIVFIT